MKGIIFAIFSKKKKYIYIYIYIYILKKKPIRVAKLLLWKTSLTRFDYLLYSSNCLFTQAKNKQLV
ncbi:hypothetical protein K6L59_02885, partial [Candidatus Phytoplasma sp. Tabriz.2]|nr:hypothetical protein [Candidatus Phytoplasma australiense]